MKILCLRWLRVVILALVGLIEDAVHSFVVIVSMLVAEVGRVEGLAVTDVLDVLLHLGERFVDLVRGLVIKPVASFVSISGS